MSGTRNEWEKLRNNERKYDNKIERESGEKIIRKYQKKIARETIVRKYGEKVATK